MNLSSIGPSIMLSSTFALYVAHAALLISFAQIISNGLATYSFPRKVNPPLKPRSRPPQPANSDAIVYFYTIVHFFGKHILAAETNFDYFIMADGNIVAKYDLSLVVLGFDETALSCVFHLRLNQYMDQAKSQGLYMAHLSCHE